MVWDVCSACSNTECVIVKQVDKNCAGFTPDSGIYNPHSLQLDERPLSSLYCSDKLNLLACAGVNTSALQPAGFGPHPNPPPPRPPSRPQPHPSESARRAL